MSLWIPLRAITDSLPQQVSDTGVRVMPRLILSGLLRSFRWSASAGYLHRPLATLGDFRYTEGSTAGSQVQVGFAAAYTDTRLGFSVGPELVFATGATSERGFSKDATTLELLLGGQYSLFRQVQLGLALGLGILREPGTPDFRLLFRVAYAPIRAADRDGDGIRDTADACPDEPGVRSESPSNNGCPAIRPVPDKRCAGAECAGPKNPSAHPSANPSANPSASPSAAPAEGVYVRIDPGRPLAAQLRDQQDADGVAITVPWSALEPYPAEYRWGPLDDAIAEARRLRKRIILSVPAGVSTPEWLYSQGAAKYSFLSTDPELAQRCVEQAVPIPWDRIFQEAFLRLLGALGQRYNGNPYLSAVVVTGINFEGDETAAPLPVPPPSDNGDIVCQKTSAAIGWAELGYSRSRIERTWVALLKGFAAAFSSHPLLVSTSADALPRVGDLAQDAPHRVLLQRAEQELGSRLLLAHSRAPGPSNEPWDVARAVPAGVGLALPVRPAAAPADPGGALERALALDARFVILRPAELAAVSKTPLLQRVQAQLRRKR